MSGSGAPSPHTDGGGPPDGTGLTVEIVAARWHAEILDSMVAEAVAACEGAGAAVRVTRVPGTVELTVVAEALAARGARAIVALGVVIRGDTPHFDYVCQSVTQGLTDVSRTHRVPVGFGVLTCDDERQARDRSGLPGSRESKGREAAEAVIATARILDNLG